MTSSISIRSPISPGGPNAVNVVTVFNTEHVFGALADDDQIHIGGNSEGMTTVTGGIGSDQIWASADVDHFRFESAGHSAFDLYDTPAGGSHDLITDFDDSEDQLVFDGVEFETATFSWQQLDFGDVDYVIVDTDGNSGVDSNGNYVGYEMVIQLQDINGSLTASNFLVI